LAVLKHPKKKTPSIASVNFTFTLILIFVCCKSIRDVEPYKILFSGFLIKSTILPIIIRPHKYGQEFCQPHGSFYLRVLPPKLSKMAKFYLLTILFCSQLVLSTLALPVYDEDRIEESNNLELLNQETVENADDGETLTGAEEDVPVQSSRLSGETLSTLK
jgi:hypothetical protein